MCRWCARGLVVVDLDEDGALTSVSGRPGTRCHGVDDVWWPCEDVAVVEPPARVQCLPCPSCGYVSTIRRGQFLAVCRCGYRYPRPKPLSFDATAPA